MNVAELRHASSPSHTYLLVPILLLFGLLVVATLRAPTLITNAGIGSAIIVASPLILATYALTIIAMAGRVSVDLSIGPLIGFINVSMVQLYAAKIITTPVEFFAYAIAVGVLYQLVMGLIIVYVRVQPIIVALSGFLALVGLNLVILRRPGGVVPEWMQHWGLGTEILSPVLAVVVVATLAWFALTRTAFFGHLRLMGSDERTAYVSGVRINIVRLGAHVIAGVYAAMAALTFTSLIASGDPNQGTTYTLMAVTALVLGGTSLAGGRGSIIGSLFGALNIYLITYVLSTFSFGRVQSFVTEAAYGVVLVVSLLLTLALPKLPRQVARVSPYAFFVLLGVLAFGVILYSKEELKPPPAPAQVSGQAQSGGSGIQSLGSGSGSSGGSGIQSLGSGSGSS
ncbi:MAG: ABC transporter permease, partial [Rhodospirillaceae bacterium]|nr:ABC transporter permease [Rhodospirillaceae bacterium]